MFDLEKTVEKRFGSFDETLAFVSEEKRRMVRIPITGLWNEGAGFHEAGDLVRVHNSSNLTHMDSRQFAT